MNILYTSHLQEVCIIDFLLHLALLLPVFLIITQIQFHVHANYVKIPTTQVTEENSKS